MKILKNPSLSFTLMTTIFADIIDIPEKSTSPTFASRNPNFALLCRLMMTVCVDLFRDVLDFYIDPAEQHTEIQETLKYLSTMKHYKRDGVPIFDNLKGEKLSSKTLDLSMLYIVIRSVCCIPQPTNGWGCSPKTDDRSLAASIERIRIFGIKILDHSEEINDTDFQDIWRNLRTNIDEIQKLVLIKHTYAGTVDELFSNEHISTRYINRFRCLKGKNLNVY